jgi:molybdopterin-guanine dinucleotide biosynthesis protein A
MDVSDPAYPARGEEPPRLGAVVLTGGTAARMDGVDKASIELDGVTLLERALAATMTAVEVVVVGDQVPTSRPVTWTFEDPRGGGPAAGVLAGLDRFLRPPDLVAVLAVDMPRVSAGTVARLAAAVTPGVDGAVLLDTTGRRQWLCAVYRRTSLEAARPTAQEDEHGLPAHRLLDGLTLAEVEAVDQEADDVDTWTDLRELRQDREERDRRTP